MRPPWRPSPSISAGSERRVKTLAPRARAARHSNAAGSLECINRAVSKDLQLRHSCRGRLRSEQGCESQAEAPFVVPWLHLSKICGKFSKTESAQRRGRPSFAPINTTFLSAVHCSIHRRERAPRRCTGKQLAGRVNSKTRIESRRRAAGARAAERCKDVRQQGTEPTIRPPGSGRPRSHPCNQQRGPARQLRWPPICFIHQLPFGAQHLGPALICPLLLAS